jgi:hypothetical protein
MLPPVAKKLNASFEACPVVGQRREPCAWDGGLDTLGERTGSRLAGDGMGCAQWILMNAALDLLTEAAEKVFDFVAPSISFGLYAGAEALFLYGLYMAFLGSPHGHP